MPSRASLADTSEVQDIFCRRAHGLARANSQKVGVRLIQTSPARRSGTQTKGGLGLGLHGRLDRGDTTFDITTGAIMYKNALVNGRPLDKE